MHFLGALHYLTRELVGKMRSDLILGPLGNRTLGQGLTLLPQPLSGIVGQGCACTFTVNVRVSATGCELNELTTV